MSTTVNLSPTTPLIKGVNTLAQAVKSTLGPKGRNVILQKPYQQLHVTKDGVTVAESIELEDAIENLGASIVKQASSRTASLAGDGTTTATVLAQSIIQEGQKFIQSGVAPITIKRQLEKSLPEVLKYIKDNSIQVADDWEKIQHVATISANGDSEIGSLVTKAMKQATIDGVVAVKEARSLDTYIEEVNGLRYNKGYLSPYFVTDPSTMSAEYDDTYILLYDGKLRNPQHLIPIIDQVYRQGGSLLVVAQEIEAQALQFLVVNKLRKGLKVIATQAPGFGNNQKKQLEDLATVTGATLVTEDTVTKLDQIDIDHLGFSDSVSVTKDHTTIVGGNSDKKELDSRIATVRAELNHAQNEYEETTIKERLAKLIGGVVVLHVGAATEAELKEKKDRIDDALSATSAAIQEGIVPGGGYTFFQASLSIPYEDWGSQILTSALESPLKSICENAGADFGFVKASILDKKKGWDAYKDSYVDLVKEGIIDPAMVTRVALESAVSAASTILMTSTTVTPTNSEETTEYPM